MSIFAYSKAMIMIKKILKNDDNHKKDIKNYDNHKKEIKKYIKKTG